MIRRFLPYPVLTLGLVTMWLLLSGFTPGQFIIGACVGVGASHALRALGEPRPRIGSWRAVFELLGIVAWDIARSNIAVARILLSRQGRPRRAGFVLVPLRLRNPIGLAALSVVVTSTPGTAWIDYNSTRGELLIHVFDLVDEDDWIELIANRYERLLLEIFE